jgi:hypothetical protein
MILPPDRATVDAHAAYRDDLDGPTVSRLLEGGDHDRTNCVVCAQLDEIARMAEARTRELVAMTVGAWEALEGGAADVIDAPESELRAMYGDR